MSHFLGNPPRDDTANDTAKSFSDSFTVAMRERERAVDREKERAYFIVLYAHSTAEDAVEVLHELRQDQDLPLSRSGNLIISIIEDDARIQFSGSVA